jgi:glycosyltransferase involved in cell wall biosynthesis
MRICLVATVPFVLRHHLRSQIQAAISAGHEVHLVSSAASDFQDEIRDDCDIAGAHFHAIEIPRKISPTADLRALVILYNYFRKTRFDIVHSVTSKAGLLCALAAKMARVPIRLHTFAGQPWARLSGPARWIARACDRIVIRVNTQCYADSESQKTFLVEEGIGRSDSIKTLGAGSIAGVDLVRFSPGRFEKDRIRAELAIPLNARVIVFVGRVARDKGIRELVAAFDRLSRMGAENICLLIVGPLESAQETLAEDTRGIMDRDHRIKMIGYSDEPEKYLAIADVFCLPSYREGFGSVVIEAAAMGVPSVVTRVVGLVDAVEEEETGLFVPPNDVDALAGALARLLGDDELRERMGLAAKNRACALFDSVAVNQLVIFEYARLAALRR